MKATPIKIAFWGTPEFALPILDALKASNLTPSLIITGTDKPFGRKQIVSPPPVKCWALENGVPVDQPLKIAGYAPEGEWDLFVVAAYGKIIPSRILEIPRYGTLNVHPSLLPRFRGAAPLQSAILAGETNTGVTIMLMDQEMDHGPILASVPYRMSPNETYVSLHDTLAKLGGSLLAATIPHWIKGSIAPEEQDHSRATFTKKITTEDAVIDFGTMSPEEIDRKVRALNPEPGTFAYFDIGAKKLRVKILKTFLADGKLTIETVQPEGRTPMSWEAFNQRCLRKL